MARRREPDDIPPWLDLTSQRCVIEVIAALYNHGPAAFDTLRTYAELDGDGHHTAAAIRRLAAWQMCQRSGPGGSWDGPATPSQKIIYELTDYGHRFAQTMEGWKAIVDQIPPELLRSLRRRR